MFLFFFITQIERRDWLQLGTLGNANRLEDTAALQMLEERLQILITMLDQMCRML